MTPKTGPLASLTAPTGRSTTPVGMRTANLVGKGFAIGIPLELIVRIFFLVHAFASFSYWDFGAELAGPCRGWEIRRITGKIFRDLANSCCHVQNKPKLQVLSILRFFFPKLSQIFKNKILATNLQALVEPTKPG
jgi:hypothetical protein